MILQIIDTYSPLNYIVSHLYCSVGCSASDFPDDLDLRGDINEHPREVYLTFNPRHIKKIQSDKAQYDFTPGMEYANHLLIFCSSLMGRVS